MSLMISRMKGGKLSPVMLRFVVDFSAPTSTSLSSAQCRNETSRYG